MTDKDLLSREKYFIGDGILKRPMYLTVMKYSHSFSTSSLSSFVWKSLLINWGSVSLISQITETLLMSLVITHRRSNQLHHLCYMWLNWYHKVTNKTYFLFMFQLKCDQWIMELIQGAYALDGLWKLSFFIRRYQLENMRIVANPYLDREEFI